MMGLDLGEWFKFNRKLAHPTAKNIGSIILTYTSKITHGFRDYDFISESEKMCTGMVCKRQSLLKKTENYSVLGKKKISLE